MSQGNQSIRAWSVGLDMVYSAGGMLLLGAGIDWFFGTKPWWMLGLGLLGLIVGMYKFIRDAMRFNTQAGMKPQNTGWARKPDPKPDGDEKESG